MAHTQSTVGIYAAVVPALHLKAWSAASRFTCGASCPDWHSVSIPFRICSWDSFWPSIARVCRWERCMYSRCSHRRWDESTSSPLMSWCGALAACTQTCGCEYDEQCLAKHVLPSLVVVVTHSGGSKGGCSDTGSAAC